MNLVRIFWVFFALLVFSVTAFCTQENKTENAQNAGYEYNDHNKKDPLVPVVDSEGRVLLILETETQQGDVNINITIQGIIYNGPDSKVLIDNRLLKRGDKLGQIEIREIYKDFIIVFDGKKEHQIKVK